LIPISIGAVAEDDYYLGVDDTDPPEQHVSADFQVQEINNQIQEPSDIMTTFKTYT